MIEFFHPADYVIAVLAIVFSVMGLFRGFSGMLAFALASASAMATGSVAWNMSEPYFELLWARGLAVLLAVLFAFWIVRVIVRKLVNGLLAQPADAIFGFLAGVLLGALLPVGWAFSGLFLEYSYLASEVAGYVG